MFRCGVCGQMSEPKEPCTVIVVEWRQKAYAATEHDGVEDRFGAAKKRWGRPGEGFEIARTVKACSHCVRDGRAKDVLRPEKKRLDGPSTVSTALSTGRPAQHKYIRREVQPEAAV